MAPGANSDARLRPSDRLRGLRTPFPDQYPEHRAPGCRRRYQTGNAIATRSHYAGLKGVVGGMRHAWYPATGFFTDD